jgi:hypothetical protein
MIYTIIKIIKMLLVLDQADKVLKRRVRNSDGN